MAGRPEIEMTGLDGEPVQLAFHAQTEMLRELAEGGRLEAFFRAFTFKVADASLKELKKKVPKDMGDYARSLRMYEVKPDALKVPNSPPGKVYGYTVHVQPENTTLSEDKAKERVIFIEPLPGQPVERRKPWVDLLIDHSPWTMDTLPIVPEPKEARVVFRAASKTEVALVAQQRRIKLPAVRAELARLGAKPPPQKKPITGTDDIAFQVLRLEFGFSSKKKPIWRPLLHKARLRCIKEWTANPYWLKFLFDPKSEVWKRWRTTPKKLPKADRKLVKTFTEFVRKIQV